jgi:hypothetical protein
MPYSPSSSLLVKSHATSESLNSYSFAMTRGPYRQPRSCASVALYVVNVSGSPFSFSNV